MAPLLEVTELSTQIRLRRSVVQALDGVSLSVDAGQCLGLVGESGSGKTLTALSVLRLLPPGGVITGGRVSLDGIDLVALSERAMHQVRGNRIGMIFQDPTSSLNPTMTIGAQVAEPLLLHRGLGKGAAARRAAEVLSLVRMPEPERVAAQYPHELSGGMRQRAMIAIALACEPQLLIADEPTTALDVTVQREILELIAELRQRLAMAVILVTHDLGVIGAYTDQTAVMYAGQIVECAATAAIFGGPRHPYTEALFDALPEMAQASGRSMYSIPGQPPDLSSPAGTGEAGPVRAGTGRAGPVRAGAGPGCRFAPRCRRAREFCGTHEPALDGDHPGHLYACFFPAGQAGAAGLGAPPLISAWTRPAGDLSDGDPAAGGPTTGDPTTGDPTADDPATGGPAAGDPAAGAPAAGAPVAGGPGSGESAAPLLSVSGLVKSYPVTSGAVLSRKVGEVSAVADVSFEVAAGQTFGLVGESGCGKTTVARLIVGLERATSGSIVFRGADGAGAPGQAGPAGRSGSPGRSGRRGLRWRQPRGRPGIQLMFQDPYGSLDPRMRVEAILREPLIIQGSGRKRAHWRTVARILDEVGLPADSARRYAREFSGGQRQRLALARALILQPDLIIADEPVSALDVSVQAQILNLMRRLQRQYGLSYLFISHDLSVVRYMADVMGVMYLGKLVEAGPAEVICTSPAHPYTRGLIDAVPVVGLAPAGARDGAGISGEPPAASRPPSGCRFRTRCSLAAEICATREPPLRPVTPGGQLVACHFPLTGDGPPARGSAAAAIVAEWA
jgi:peptide/nickel transport system ATP-binding protein